MLKLFLLTLISGVISSSAQQTQIPTQMPTQIPTQIPTKPKSYPINQEEAQDIIDETNRARRTANVSGSDLQLVTYDTNLGSCLQQYVNSINPYWFFDLYNVPYNPLHPMQVNGMYLMESEQFKNMSCYVPEFEGYEYIFHDTSNNDNSAVSDIFKYRINQNPCFTYHNCISTEYTYYRTCATNPLPKNLNCNVFYYYYPLLMMDNLSSLACVRLGVPGPNTPSNQPNSFFCYRNIIEADTNDIPYTSGKACSGCPTQTCIAGLCH